MKYLVDVGDPNARVALGVCGECPNARFLARDYKGALEKLGAHEAKFHPLTKHVRSNLARLRHADVA